jgi:hypothetical protein
MRTPTLVTTRELAQRIRDALFANGQGQRADRLVLMTTGDHDLGGWSRAGAQHQIEKILRES